jgi:hypothetical protein
MTERRTGILFKVLLFILRHAIPSSHLTHAALRERHELESELEKEINNIGFRCQQ